MDIKKELGEKIKRVRKLRDLTQEELAEMIDISPRSLSNIEVGASFVKAETLEKILEVLNITPQDLFKVNHLQPQEDLVEEIIASIKNIKVKKPNNANAPKPRSSLAYSPTRNISCACARL